MATGRLALIRLARWRGRPLDSRRAEASFAPRHGKAVEPARGSVVEAGTRKRDKEEESRREGEESKRGEESGTTIQPGEREQDKMTAQTRRGEEDKKTTQARGDDRTRKPTSSNKAADTSNVEPAGASGQLLPALDAHDAHDAHDRVKKPLEMMILKKTRCQPQMAAPPYVHHFDSYSLVKQLQGGGYTQQQATTAMKGIRTLLAQNLDVAQESLVSKSDVENESYLFTAACSELSTEIKNNRRLQHEQTRQQRTVLQHEVDILTQTLNQELLTLNDNVRGMFNDRTMAVREEQKAVESAIQKINYKMSILLSSDCKSEIEGVRWILIRRSVLGILFMAMLALAVLRYASYKSQQHRRQAEEVKEAREQLRRDGGRSDHSAAADAAAMLAAG
ncbi:hypothetical protein XA68_17623 [Ophiocordyceps unilateralis]|uniref:MOZ protein represents a chromatin-associated acetyltransferase n=1 Tax=Ophiocordyceps unilateralis TaxID=268505 RepID=A0A2A9P4H4_OPHUN|nr:hypothetical protein XA68_17623 [Ophiocordyceps unilateralis]